MAEPARERVEKQHDAAWSRMWRAWNRLHSGDRSFRAQQAYIDASDAVLRAQRRLDELDRHGACRAAPKGHTFTE